MDRAKVIFTKYPSQIILAFSIVLGAIVLFAACLTSLASAAPNRLGIFAGGQVKQSNSRDMSSILSVQRMMPGQIAHGTVVIANDGSASEQLTLTALVRDAATGNGGRLSQELRLRVTDVTDRVHPSVVYQGVIGGLSGASAGRIAAAHSRTYLFTVTFPSGADQSFSGSSSSVEFDWTAME